MTVNTEITIKFDLYEIKTLLMAVTEALEARGSTPTYKMSYEEYRYLDQLESKLHYAKTLIETRF